MGRPLRGERQSGQQCDSQGYRIGRAHEEPGPNCDFCTGEDLDIGRIGRANRDEDQCGGDQRRAESEPAVPTQPEVFPGLTLGGAPGQDEGRDDCCHRSHQQYSADHRILCKRMDRPC